ncbi:hypothetical protein [Marinimicrobium alkaliphilum]|uniref:hypothetical protein n=1 Tax=Marinimicrobium alkaliphilum TaxID=2202654 RepID=UPI000DBAB79E|nr:hypothetical protein [Marinimicrobium alkaliphilum]
MNAKLLVSGLVVVSSVLAGPLAWAEDDDLDVIMTIVDEDDSPDDAVQRIALPMPSTRVQPQRDSVEAEELQRVRAVVTRLLQDTDSELSQLINEAIAAGELDRLPDIIIDSLPEDLINDLTSDVDDLTDELIETLPLSR